MCLKWSAKAWLECGWLLQDSPEPCRSWLASEGLESATFILLKRVIVNDLRWQASSYEGLVYARFSSLMAGRRCATPAFGLWERGNGKIKRSSVNATSETTVLL
jgi:hypothetical protein